MELRHLRYFIAVADTLSFTAAAENLGVSQPPLSQQIRALETELGVDLFKRSSRQVSLTRAGAAFLERARSILEQVQSASEHARSIGSGSSGILNIGLTGSVLIGPLAQIMNAFSIRYPDVDVRTHEMSPGEQIVALKARRTDLSFLRSPPDDLELTRELGWREKVVVVLPKDHPLARHEIIKLRWLKDERYVSLRLKDSRFANELMNACIAQGFVPRITQQVVESYSLLSLVAAEFGIALAPESVSQLSHPNVVYRPLEEPSLIADVFAVRLPNEDAIIENFLSTMRDQLTGKAPDFSGTGA